MYMNIEDYFIGLFRDVNNAHFYTIKKNIVFMVTISSRLMVDMNSYQFSETFYEKIHEHIDLSSSKLTNSSIIGYDNIDFEVIYSINDDSIKKLKEFEDKLDILRKRNRINNIDKLLDI